MKLAVLIAVLCIAGPTMASPDSLCEATRADVEQFAQARGLRAEVRCRMAGSRGTTVATSAQGMAWPRDMVLKSGPMAWPMRVQLGNGVSSVQRVPVTVGWIAGAWVSTHNLLPGDVLQASDFEMQSRRWPDGMAVQPADATRRPSGRMRQALRAGELLADSAVLASDSLMRGDHVTAVLAEGAMEVRVPAQLLASARVGERTRVQATGRLVPLEGRLTDAQTLRVDSE